MKNLCPECGSNLAQVTPNKLPGFDAHPVSCDDTFHEDRKAAPASASASQHGGNPRGYRQTAASNTGKGDATSESFGGVAPEQRSSDHERKNQAIWRCVNPDCPTEVRVRLARWCAPEAMDIAGADEKLIAQLVARGLVLDVADFYRLKFGELMELEGMTEAVAKDFLAAIAASKTRDWWRLLAGLGIPEVDAGAAQSLARAFKNLDDLAGAPLARLTASAGEAVAQSVARWFGERQHHKLIQRLGKAGLF